MSSARSRRPALLRDICSQLYGAFDKINRPAPAAPQATSRLGTATSDVAVLSQRCEELASAGSAAEARARWAGDAQGEAARAQAAAQRLGSELEGARRERDALQGRVAVLEAEVQQLQVGRLLAGCCTFHACLCALLSKRSLQQVPAVGCEHASNWFQVLK